MAEVIQPGVTSQIPFDGSPSEQEKTEIKRLRMQNPLYKIYEPEWKKYLDCFEGGPDILSINYIYQHQRENDLDYQDRVRRAHYFNYCEILVKFFTRFIFGETIQREADAANRDWYEAWSKNVDRKGTSIQDYMEDLSDDKQVFGMVFTLVDAPPLPDGVDPQTMSVADERDFNMEPYLVRITPEEMLDWVVDEFETLQYIKRKQLIDILDGRERLAVERYTEWYQDEVTISEIDVTDPRNPRLRPAVNKVNELGYIPMVVTRYQRSKRVPWMGNSFLRNLAGNNIEILNLTSLNDEFLYRQCFNLLARETDAANSLPLKDQEDDVLSQANILDVPKGAQFPEYVSPPSEPAEYISDERQRVKNEMFTIAAQDTLNELFNGEKRSGFSQAQSFSKTVPFISTRADILQDSEHKIMQMVLSRKGKEWAGTIKYKDRYEITNLTDAITQLSMLAKDMQLESPTFFKEELKRLVAEYDGQINTDTRLKIFSEIDGMDFTAWFETQRTALIGAPKSPADQQKPKSTGTTAEAAAESKTTNTKATKKTR
jgi:hypothetical protein